MPPTEPDRPTGEAGIFITRVEPARDGPRLAVKDILDTAGVRTTYGSAIFADHVPDRDAESVRRLEAAGYVLVGKANLHEFAFGMTSENPHYGTVPNPLAAGRIAGGSSGGSAAALAAGLADAALGSDTAGSIRAPAACCGIVGFKPTFGLVPVEGCFPLAPSFDHVGPMARSVSACAEMMAALAPEMDPVPELAPEDVEVGVGWTAEAEPLVRSRVTDAAATFPRRREIALPAMPPGVADVRMRETAQTHAELFAEHRDLYGEDVAAKLDRCLRVTDAEYEAGRRARERYRERFAELTRGVDVLLTPTEPMVAPPVGVGDLALRDRLTRFTYPFDAIGAPALAIPCGPAEEGLPASAQLAGRPGADALVLGVGALLERALGHTGQP
ncbi:MAG TPA: amidase [Solirubrobacterales bacterium]|jgi:aspartyl-tRNA(Asn)/glutamyl-tRNA(Gln) amidotransferase subunit A